MTLIARLIAKYALGIYILCGLGMLFYLRAAMSARREGAYAIYSLERESAAKQVYRSSGMILVLLLIVVGVYVLSDYTELPSSSTSLTPEPTQVENTATPTKAAATSTPAAPTPTIEPTSTRRSLNTSVVMPTIVQDTPIPQVIPASCPHPNVQVLQPGQNQVINQGIEVRGTATKDRFDRYEFKFKNQDIPNDDWHWVQTFKTPVQNGSLGIWQTSHLPSGNYRLMLIAIDVTGNSQECIVPVIIQH